MTRDPDKIYAVRGRRTETLSQTRGYINEYFLIVPFGNIY